MAAAPAGGQGPPIATVLTAPWSTPRLAEPFPGTTCPPAGASARAVLAKDQNSRPVAKSRSQTCSSGICCSQGTRFRTEKS